MELRTLDQISTRDQIFHQIYVIFGLEGGGKQPPFVLCSQKYTKKIMFLDLLGVCE